MSLGRVDRYELLAQIGQGSFGGVYRARHIHTGQVHALKLARDTVDPDGAARVLAEARAAASLHHPNVVGVIDGGVAATGEAFIVMELLEGSTLQQIIAREGPLPPERATRIVRQMLDGLAAAHANGIVHRDVKPSNVFIIMASDVTGGDMVKVIDFGISKVRLEGSEAGMTLPGMAMGTPGYMAPEQLGDARSVDPRADLYAVGATFFEMLTKRRPIMADSFESWMRQLTTERAPSLREIAPHLPPALAAVVDRALARDVDGRWPSAIAMRDALDTAVSIPHAGYAPTAWDTPRAVVHPTHPSTNPGMSAQGASQPGAYPLTNPVTGSGWQPVVPPLSPYGASTQPYGAPPAGTQPYGAPPQPQTAPLHPLAMTPNGANGATQQSQRSGSIVPWIIGAAVLVLGVAGIVGVFVFFYITRDAAVASAASPPVVSTAPTAPGTTPIATGATPAPRAANAPAARPGQAAPVPANPAAPGTAPAPVAPAAPSKATGAVRIAPPRIIGELRQDQFMALANRARPQVESCNPDKRAIVIKVDIMIGDKKISIAQPSVNTNPGDPLIARCVAQSLKDAQSPSFAPGDSGIYQEAQFTWQ